MGDCNNLRSDFTCMSKVQGGVLHQLFEACSSTLEKEVKKKPNCLVSASC